MELVLTELKRKNIVVSWKHFYLSAVKNGWKWKTIKDRIRYTVKDIYGPEYCREVMERLELMKKEMDMP